MSEQSQSPGDKPPQDHRIVERIALGAAIVLLFLVAVVMLQDAQDHFSNRTTVKQAADGASVHLSFSDPLPIFTGSSPRFPLLIWVTSSAASQPAKAASALYVSAVQEPALAVLGADGEPLGAAPLAVASQVDQLSGAFFLAATHVLTDLRPSATLRVSITPVSASGSISETDEVQSAQAGATSSEVEFVVPLNTFMLPPFYPLPISFWAREIVQMADAIALVLAVILGAWEWRNWREKRDRQREEDRRRENDRRMADQQREDDRKREDQQRENDRRMADQQREDDRKREGRLDRLERVESFLQQHWLDGVAELATIKERAEIEKWGEDLGQKIVYLQDRYCAPIKTEIAKFLRESGAAYRQAEDMPQLRRRLVGGKCFSDELYEKLKPCLAILDDPKTTIGPLSEVFKLWDEYSYDAQDVIVAISMIADKEAGGDAFLRIIRDELEKDGRDPLATDPWFRTKCGRPSVPYEWLPYRIPPNRPLQPQYPDFLMANGLSADPFASISESVNQDGVLLNQEWLKPPDSLLSLILSESDRASSVAIAQSPEDGLACILATIRQLKNSPDAFPIAGAVTFWRNDLSLDLMWLESLCRIAGDWWITLMVGDPHYFLGQPHPQQEMIFDLLLWLCGSVEILEYSLQIADVKLGGGELDLATAKKRALRDRLRYLAGQRAHPDNPPPAQLIQWLEIRPPGRDSDLDYTVIFVLGQHFPNNVNINLGRLVNGLRQRRVYFHILVDQEAAGNFLGIRAQRLEWSDESITSMIDDRVHSLSDPKPAIPRTLSNLVTLSNPMDNPYNLVVDAANGSLHRALDFCMAAVSSVEERGSGDHILTTSALRSTYEDFRNG